MALVKVPPISIAQLYCASSNALVGNTNYTARLTATAVASLISKEGNYRGSSVSFSRISFFVFLARSRFHTYELYLIQLLTAIHKIYW